MKDTLTFVTGNLNKVSELERNLGFTLKHTKLDLPEIQSLDIEALVEQKARAAFAMLNTPVLVEDSSLIFHALGKLPGTFIKWFVEELGYEGTCRLLDHYSDKSTTACACFGKYDGKILETFIGESKGTISESPSEGNGFGWDCIFIPEGNTKTWAELGPEEKDKTSHRSRAVAKLKKSLEVL